MGSNPTQRKLVAQSGRARHARDAGKVSIVFSVVGTLFVPSSLERKLYAEWVAENESMLRENVVGIAFVTSSRLIRGVITAVAWINPLSCPHFVSGDKDEAIRWCREQLAERRSSRN